MDFFIDVGTSKLKISPQMPKTLFMLLKKKLTFIMKGFEFTTGYKEYGWDGRICKLFVNHTAPAGYALRIKKLLEEEGHVVSLRYINNYDPKGSTKVHGIDLEEFQLQAVKKGLKYRRGIISAPVRAGKTAIAAALINSIDHYPVWFVTYGKDLVRQTCSDLSELLQRPVGFLSESEYSPGNIVVTSYQAIGRIFPPDPKRKKRNNKPLKPVSFNIAKRNESIISDIKLAKVVLLDECHHALAPANSRILQEIPSAGYVIGLSGTPNPTNRHTLEVEAAIGPIIHKVKYQTLINCERIARPRIVIYQLPYRWFTSTGLKAFDDFYEANIVENRARNQFISDVVKRMNSEGKTCFIMVRKLDHGPLLRNLIPGSIFVHGHISSRDRQQIYKSLIDKKVMCIIATVGKEGLNLPSLDVVINAEGYSSRVTTVQKMRSLTAHEGKKYGIIVDFMDRGKYLNKHSKHRISIYEGIGDSSVIIKQVPGSYFPEIPRGKTGGTH